jgi:hypothetical protein
MGTEEHAAAIAGGDPTGIDTFQPDRYVLGFQEIGEKQVAVVEADAGTRTPDPFITSEVLYQLSYVGVATRIVAPLGNRPRSCLSRPLAGSEALGAIQHQLDQLHRSVDCFVGSVCGGLRDPSKHVPHDVLGELAS